MKASSTKTSQQSVGIQATGNSRNTLSLRLVELFAFFAIVLVARFLGDFRYESTTLLILFVAAVLLQYNGEVVVRWIGRRAGWDGPRRERVSLWHSSLVDLLVVIALIYLTGTIESPFLFLVAVPLFFAGNLFAWKPTVRVFLSTAMAAIAGLGWLEMQGLIPHHSCYSFQPELYRDGRYLAGSLLVVAALSCLVLFLSSAFQRRHSLTMARLRRRRQESESRVNELSRLYDISLGINSAISMETLLRIVAREAMLLLDGPWASIVLFNDRQEVCRSVFVGLNQNHELELDRRMRRGGLSEWIWTHNAPIVVEDISKDKRANCSDFLTHFGIRSIVGYPLTAGKRVIGAIYTGDFAPKPTSKRQITLLATLSAQLGTAIEKSSLYESLERKLRDCQKQMAALEKTNILKSDFVNHVSHELRTPLTSIKAYVETLLNNVGDPSFTQRDEFLSIVSSETDRLIRIVNDILDVSKIEFGQRPLERASFRLCDAVDDVVNMLSPTLREADIVVEVDLPDDLPRIEADRDLIKQVLINLISNAVKYSPTGTAINISAHEEALEVVVVVSDQGIGIPESELDNVFDKYFRVRSENTTFEGVGLGLAIVKNIVEQHGGTIRAESKEGEGSTFRFTIPREQCVNDLVGYIGEVVDARATLHEMLELIVRMIAELLQAKIISLMLLDKNRSELFIKMSYGLDEWIVENTRVKVGESIAGKVAETGVPLFIHNIEENEIYSCPNNPQYDTVSLLSVPLVVSDVVVGVINVNNKTDGEPFTQDDLNLLISFGERISRALERVHIAEDSSSYLEDTIEAFTRMLDTQASMKAVEVVVDMAVKTSRRLGLDDKEVSVIQYVASVHDIGMTEISDGILNKAIGLTSAERQKIERHPQRGAELIRPLEFVESVSNIILYHHERVDGEGYPMGLRGDQIPIGARVLAVIDAFQSMTTDRPYRGQRSVEGAVRELVACSGRQFDAEVVDAFIAVLKEEGKISSEKERELKRSLDEVGAGSPNP